MTLGLPSSIYNHQAGVILPTDMNLSENRRLVRLDNEQLGEVAFRWDNLIKVVIIIY